ncbi:phosphoribosylanthranilate isomerase [Desulfoscipio gibsoniae]|uniref:N-(5'-phosphoribosyl)anthranilate isomerase n=1 Tax=Desulfoscipio gibsoniae DSM 7213 TaxID=767817 RepID=R4KKC0_9FIRM|nr:phosphoribosylanthranilate isomerase [Desulfoscipio gibsoniae]AGL03099.1 phosphoribosylanthranilate isomerase [Desulfoscipio gibsoniae DSM 7213]
MKANRRWRLKSGKFLTRLSFRGLGFEGRRVRVKICGVSDAATALAAIEAGADALGFVFADSRRRVTPEIARDIIRQLPPFVARVGVFVDTAPVEMADLAAYCGLTAIQISGADNFDGTTSVNSGDGQTDSNALPGCTLDCARCSKQTMADPVYSAAPSGQTFYYNLPVIKTLRVGAGRALPVWPGCQAAAFLFDTYKKDSYGGTGETFDWQILQNMKCPKPVILAGGLTAANVQSAIKLAKPYAVDVSGGVESDGRKDVHKIKEFISQAKGVLI